MSPKRALARRVVKWCSPAIVPSRAPSTTGAGGRTKWSVVGLQQRMHGGAGVATPNSRCSTARHPSRAHSLRQVPDFVISSPVRTGLEKPALWLGAQPRSDAGDFSMCFIRHSPKEAEAPRRPRRKFPHEENATRRDSDKAGTTEPVRPGASSAFQLRSILRAYT